MAGCSFEGVEPLHSAATLFVNINFVFWLLVFCKFLEPNRHFTLKMASTVHDSSIGFSFMNIETLLYVMLLFWAPLYEVITYISFGIYYLLYWIICFCIQCRFDPWSLLYALKRKAISLGVEYVDGEAVGFEFKKMPDMLMDGIEPGSYETVEKVLVCINYLFHRCVV